MATFNPKSLVAKLNSTCREALQSALGLCVSQTNHEVQLDHWLLKMIEVKDGDLPRILRHYDVDTSHVSKELTKNIDRFRRGNDRQPTLSPEILDMMRDSWGVASLRYSANRIRSGYVLATLLTDREWAGKVQNISTELAKLPANKLEEELPVLIEGTIEDTQDVSDYAGPTGESGAARPSADSKTPSLDQFTLNLTERARTGEIDPVIGRDAEIRQVIDILTRRRQNNPILTGEAGVGKTAVVEGFALRIAAGDVPPSLKNVALRTLDLGLLQAGAGVKGEFENRLKGIISEVKASPQPIILFIDEAHTIIGAGGQAGQGDAANLLKPALARGELRTIAATTWMEYKKYFETDAALKRRFQVVKVDEPDVDLGIRMMRGLTETLEKHHNTRILEEAVEDAVKLSHRYMTERQLPDKSVSLLDTAAARVALGHSAIPSAVEDARREVEHLDVEIKILERETATGAAHDHKLTELRESKSKTEEQLAALEKRWNNEKELVEQIQEIRDKLEAHAASDGKEEDKLMPDEEKQSKDELARLTTELKEIQGESPLVMPVVDRQAVAEVVSNWTGIPVGKMVLDEIKTVLSLRERLEERIIGQSHALEAIAQRIRTARANLVDPRRPIGVFLMVGPSGVGKTETAMALADILYGGDRNMVVINMSEYKEDHKISRLTGSAPGYVGYGEGGVLTEAVRRKPYSVVLLDEIEKANESVQEIFYQVFDKGTLQDDKGTEVNFKNTIVLLTSNVGTDTIMKVCADPDTRPDADGLAEALRPDLLKSFKPALLGRMTLVPYFPLSDEVLQNIVKLQLGRITERMKDNHRAEFSYEDNLVATIAGRCKEVESGARNVDHIISGTLLPEISREILARMAAGDMISKAHVSLNGDGGFVYEIS